MNKHYLDPSILHEIGFMNSQCGFNSQSNSSSITTQLPAFCATLHSIHLWSIYPADRLRYSLADHWRTSCLGCFVQPLQSPPLHCHCHRHCHRLWLCLSKRGTSPFPLFQISMGGRASNSCCRHKSQSQSAWVGGAVPLQLDYHSTISWKAATSYTQRKNRHTNAINKIYYDRRQ